MQDQTEVTPARDSERTKKRLLDAAETIFTAVGFDAARVDRIAADAGVNKRMIYEYFRSKEGLYNEVVKRNLAGFLEAGRRVAHEEMDPYNMAVAVLTHFYNFLNENRGFVRLLTWESLRKPGPGDVELVRMLAEGLEEMFQALDRGVREGVFRPDVDTRQLALSVAGLCMTYFQRRLLMEAVSRKELSSPEKGKEVLDHIIRLIFEGILTRSPDGKADDNGIANNKDREQV